VSPLKCRKAKLAIEGVVSCNPAARKALSEEVEGGPEVLAKIPHHNEDFRGKIEDSLMLHEIQQVNPLKEWMYLTLEDSGVLAIGTMICVPTKQSQHNDNPPPPPPARPPAPGGKSERCRTTSISMLD